MRTRTFALKTALPLLTLGLLLVGSRPAMAIEVMCSNTSGDCSVSNDGFDEIECTCAEGGGGFGGTGGDQYFALTEEELLEICLEQLVLCEGQGGTDGGTEETGWGDTDGGTEETGWGGTEESGDTFGDTEMGDGDGDSSGDGDGDGDGDSGDSADSADSVGDGDGDSSGDGDGDSSGDGDGDSGDGDGDSGDGDGDSGDGDGDSAGGTNTDDGDSGESSTGADTGAAEGDASGCSCAATNSAPGIGLMLLSLFGLVRLRRRESLVS